MNTKAGCVEFDHVSKRYRLGMTGTLRGSFANLFTRRRTADAEARVLWALRDASFQLQPGESLGLVGPNGAGKTTTLKLLSHITKPTSGRIALHGRVSSLIELGAGFHPELTGRENIFLNGAILGLKRREIEKKLDAIVAFSDLEKFIDTPVKRYSSGLYVRLGFAVAAHVEPDVLLVDEVLAVGDSSFRHRCIKHMTGLRQNGTTVIFVSHNMHLVRSMCDTAVLLIGGQIRFVGSTADVISAYEQWLTEAPSVDAEQMTRSSTQGQLLLKTAKVSQLGVTKARDPFDSHQPLRLDVQYHAVQPLQVGRIDVRIIREDSVLCSTADSSQAVDAAFHHLEGEGIIVLTYAPTQLTSGTYNAVVQITDISDSVVIASVQSAPFRVHAEGAGQNRGIYVPQVTWEKSV